MEKKNSSTGFEGISLKAKMEAVKFVADIAKDALKFGKSSEEYIKVDMKSTTDYMDILKETLASINEEIKNSNDSELISQLYKQRQDILNRLETEKEKQRDFFKELDQRNKNYSSGILKVVTITALGTGGTLAAKLLLDNKKS